MMQKTEAINNGCSEKKTDNEKDKEAYESWKFADLAYQKKAFLKSTEFAKELKNMEKITGSRKTGDKYKGDKYELLDSSVDEVGGLDVYVFRNKATNKIYIASLVQVMHLIL